MGAGNRLSGARKDVASRWVPATRRRRRHRKRWRRAAANGHNSRVGTGALAARVRAGDQAAFAELYREYAERLFGFCVVLLRDRDEAADATHDTFVLAAQKVHQLRDPERLRPWLFAKALRPMPA